MPVLHCPGTGSKWLPHSLPASLRSTERSGSALAAPLGCLQAVLHPVPHWYWQGAAPGSVPHTSLMWAQHLWPAKQCQHRGALLPHSCPGLCLCKLQELSPSVNAMRINHHNTCSCHKGHTDIDKSIHKYESPHTAVQVCLTGLDLAKSLL